MEMICRSWFLAPLLSSLLTPFQLHGMSPRPSTNPTGSSTFVVATNGSDANPGTLTSPWRTVEYAFSRLSSGDTLQLRGGAYRLTNSTGLILRLAGGTNQWTTIESYPGERAWIHAGHFPQTENRGGWEAVTPSLGLYRVLSNVPTGFNAGKLGVWWLDQDLQLLQYLDPQLALSTNYLSPDCYVGPGAYVSNNQIFLRTQPNPHDQEVLPGQKPSPLPALDTDPNQLSLMVFSLERILTFEDNASYWILRNLDIGPAYQAIRITDQSHHIQIEGCKIRYKNVGIFSDASTHHLLIQSNQLTTGFPPWVCWDDVKNDFKPADASGWNSFACFGTWRNTQFSENRLEDIFDGILLQSGSSDILVHRNHFLRGRDDAIDLVVDVSQVEISENRIRHCYEGISNIGKGTNEAGPVYIHHNVIDVTGFHRQGRRAGPSEPARPLWGSGIPWGRHGDLSNNVGAIWKVYQNTVIARDCNGSTTFPKQPFPDYRHVFYNNLTVLYTNRPASLLSTSGLEDSAGNAFWHQGPTGLFSDKSGGHIEVDPAWDSSAILSQTFYPSNLDSLYLPFHPQILTPGISLTSTGWPDSEVMPYRGALPNTNQGLLAWWRFNQDFSDSARNGYDAVPLGGTGFGLTRWEGAASLQCTQTNQGVRVTNNRLITPTKRFTLSARVYPTALGFQQGIISRVTSASTKQFALSLNEAGRLVFDYEKDGNNYQLIATQSVALNRWQHVVATIDENLKVTLVQDSQVVGEGNAPLETLSSTNTPIELGRWGGTYSNTPYVFRGFLDDLRIYSVALPLSAFPFLFQTSFESWVAEYPSSQPDRTSDPDGDGITNWAEFALGGNPLLPENSVLPSHTLRNGRLEFSFFRAQPELNYLVESSQDLKTWTGISTNAGQVGQTITVQDLITTDQVPRRFLRLRILDP